jgi:hypothetical protein
VVRTVPDDGAERDLWTAQHRQADAPRLSRQVNDDLRDGHVGEPVATVEADQRTAVWNEEHGDLIVVLDLPAQPFGLEALGPLHVIDAKQDRADVRVHCRYILSSSFEIVTFVCCRHLLFWLPPSCWLRPLSWLRNPSGRPTIAHAERRSR